MRYSALLAGSTLLALLAGCLTEDPETDVDEADCLATEPDCQAPRTTPIGVGFTDCIESSIFIPLTEEVYDVPPPYVSRSSPTDPQRLAVSFASCPTTSVDGHDTGASMFGQVGVYIEPPEGLPTDRTHLYILETMGQGGSLEDAFASANKSFLNASIHIVDEIAMRAVEVTGDVEYEIMGQFLPVGKEPLTSPVSEDTLYHHFEGGWYRNSRACYMYQSTAPMQVTNADGALAQAMRTGLPLIGSASQAYSCDVRIHLEIGQNGTRA